MTAQEFAVVLNDDIEIDPDDIRHALEEYGLEVINISLIPTEE